MSELKGYCKFFSTEKGYGFVKEEQSGTEYFVHVSNCIDKIYENDEVSFNLADGKKGQQAVDVKVLN